MIPFKSVRVGPFDIKIKLLEGEARDSCLGTYSDTTMSISMRDVFATEQQRAETFLHELIHATFSVAGIHDKDSHERTVAALSTTLAGVIRDNPKLIEWLRKQLS
jgi:hypothetical protein